MPPKTRTATPRKPAARKTAPRAAAKPKADEAPPALPPGVLVLDRPGNNDVIAAMIADREPLFHLGGVTHTIPKKVPPAWSLHALDLKLTYGDSAALFYAVSMLLEPEAYSALQSCETLTPDDLKALFDALTNRILPGGAAFPKA